MKGYTKEEFYEIDFLEKIIPTLEGQELNQATARLTQLRFIRYYRDAEQDKADGQPISSIPVYAEKVYDIKPEDGLIWAALNRQNEDKKIDPVEKSVVTELVKLEALNTIKTNSTNVYDILKSISGEVLQEWINQSTSTYNTIFVNVPEFAPPVISSSPITNSQVFSSSDSVQNKETTTAQSSNTVTTSNNSSVTYNKNTDVSTNKAETNTIVPVPLISSSTSDVVKIPSKTDVINSANQNIYGDVNLQGTTFTDVFLNGTVDIASDIKKSTNNNVIASAVSGIIAGKNSANSAVAQELQTLEKLMIARNTLDILNSENDDQGTITSSYNYTKGYDLSTPSGKRAYKKACEEYARQLIKETGNEEYIKKFSTTELRQIGQQTDPMAKAMIQTKIASIPTKDEGPGWFSRTWDSFTGNYSVTKDLATRDDPTLTKSIESYISVPVAAAMETVGLLGNLANKGLVAGVDWIKGAGDDIGLDHIPGIGNFFKKKKKPGGDAGENNDTESENVVSDDQKEAEKEASKIAEQAKYAANVMYFEQYYTGSDVIISFGNKIFTDIVTCQFSYTNNKSPMWGYFSERFDAVSRGTVIVQGQFAVALTDSEKMSTVLGMRTDQDIQVKRTPDRYGYIDMVDRVSRDRFDVWVDENGFDIILTYGDQSPLSSKARGGTKIILNACHITSHMMYMDANDATPLMMVYTFFGRDENNSAFNKFMNTTPTLYDSLFRPHEMNDNLEILKYSFSILGTQNDWDEVLTEFEGDTQIAQDSNGRKEVLVNKTRTPSTVLLPNDKSGTYELFTFTVQTPAGIAEAQNWLNNKVGLMKESDGSGWRAPRKEILTTIVDSALHQADPKFDPNNEMVKSRLANIMEVDVNKIIEG